MTSKKLPCLALKQALWLHPDNQREDGG